MVSPWLVLGTALVVASPTPPPAEAEAAPPVGLAPGTTFVVDLEFSDAWEAAQVSFEGSGTPRGPGPVTPAGLRRLRESPSPEVSLRRRRPPSGATLEPAMRTIPRGNDPLFVDASIHGEFLEGGALRLSPQFERIHYFDDRDRTWTLEPSKRDVAAQARSIVTETAAQWSPELDDFLEREMLEEQLLGAALALLHDVPVDVALAGKDGPSFPELDEQLKARLPEDFPVPLHERVRRFYAETLSRVVSPVAARPERLRQRAKFEEDGVRYEVTRVFRSRGEVLVRLKADGGEEESGRALHEEVVLDARTGMVVESTSVFLRDAEVGSTWWVGSERWKTRWTSVKRPVKNAKK